MKLYLAGPDVFRPDALTWAEEVRTLVAQHGHHALIPLDNEETTAEGIFKANLDLISEADVVLAAYSGEAGQRFHAKLDTHSRASWTVGA